MPWIRVIDEKNATGKLKKIYDEIIEKRGKLSNIMMIHSLLPDTMETHLKFYMSIMFNRSKLTREERELVATAVSITNNCEYCKLHHAEALKFYWKDEEKIQAFLKDMDSFPLDERKRALVNHAKKLTLYPDNITIEDIEKLRDVGLGDDEILHLTLIIGYFNFVNRVANGLNVEFSEEEISGYKY